MKHSRMKKLMIANLFLTSSLIMLMILIPKDQSISALVIDLMSKELSGNGTEVYLYAKKVHSAVHVGALCANMETHKTQEISVWKTPLHVTRHLPNDLDIAYHAYIVYETEDPMGVKHYWSQEKQQDRLVLQHSLNKDDVIKRLSGAERLEDSIWTTEPELLLQESSHLGGVPRSFILS